MYMYNMYMYMYMYMPMGADREAGVQLCGRPRRDENLGLQWCRVQSQTQSALDCCVLSLET